jgi:hypothetical protein
MKQLLASDPPEHRAPFKCCICQKGIPDVPSLFRINAKGQPGIWACAAHRNRTDAKIDPELDAAVDIIIGEAPA